MTFKKPAAAYQSIIAYGAQKVQSPFYKSFIQSVLSGFWIGLTSHCAVRIGGVWLQSNGGLAGALILYSILFSVAFPLILLTGGNLITGDTLAVTLGSLNRSFKIWRAVVFMILNILGNFTGVLLEILLISWPSKSFAVSNTADHVFLSYLALTKTQDQWGVILVNALGCEVLICAALWLTLAAENVVGKILGSMIPVILFSLGKFEHIIANFWLLVFGLILKIQNLLASRVFGYNLAASFLGNLLAGAVIVAIPYWLCFTVFKCREKSQRAEGKAVRASGVRMHKKRGLVKRGKGSLVEVESVSSSMLEEESIGSRSD